MSKADEGAAPSMRGAAHIGTPTSLSASVGVAELTHQLVRDQLSDYLDDTLGEAARHRIDGHLAGCPPCVAFLDTMRETVRALGQLPAPKAPRGTAAKIIEQARREHAAPSTSGTHD